jgi:hypothetical protein
MTFNSCSAVTFEYESLPFKCPKYDIILVRVRSGELRGRYTGSSLPSTYSKIGYSVTLTQRYGNMEKNHLAVKYCSMWKILIFCHVQKHITALADTIFVRTERKIEYTCPFINPVI